MEIGSTLSLNSENIELPYNTKFSRCYEICAEVRQEQTNFELFSKPVF